MKITKDSCSSVLYFIGLLNNQTFYDTFITPISRFAQRESRLCEDNYSKYLVTLNTLNLNGSQIAYIYAILPPCQCKSNVIQRVLKYFSCKLFISILVENISRTSYITRELESKAYQTENYSKFPFQRSVLPLNTFSDKLFIGLFS